jgi:hypothetical protein
VPALISIILASLGRSLLGFDGRKARAANDDSAGIEAAASKAASPE